MNVDLAIQTIKAVSSTFSKLQVVTTFQEVVLIRETTFSTTLPIIKRNFALLGCSPAPYPHLAPLVGCIKHTKNKTLTPHTLNQIYSLKLCKCSKMKRIMAICNDCYLLVAFCMRSIVDTSKIYHSLGVYTIAERKINS